MRRGRRKRETTDDKHGDIVGGGGWGFPIEIVGRVEHNSPSLPPPAPRPPPPPDLLYHACPTVSPGPINTSEWACNGGRPYLLLLRRLFFGGSTAGEGEEEEEEGKWR